MSYPNAAPSAESDRVFLHSLGWPSPELIETVLTALPEDSLPDHPPERQRWLLYALLQHTADGWHLGPMAWGNDERLDRYLQAMLKGELPANLLELGPFLKYLPGNHAQTQRRRRHLLRRFSSDLRRV